MTPAQTIATIKAIAKLTFRDMTPADYGAFAGAGDKAQIAFGGEELAVILCHITGEAILTEGGDAVAVVADEDRVELHALTADYAPVCIAIALSLI